MASRRHFGSVRKLPSGRFQARYKGPDGRERTAPDTFKNKTDAGRWLTKLEDSILAGEWIDPAIQQAATVESAWLRHMNVRGKPLADSTRKDYEGYLNRWIRSHPLGSMKLADVRPATINDWLADWRKDHPTNQQIPKTYRVLHAAFEKAVSEGVIRDNPCKAKGAGAEHHPERPLPPAEAPWRIADAMRPKYRALVLMGAFSALRWGELARLRRGDVLDAGTRVLVRKSKSAAGEGRIVTLPSFLVNELRRHMLAHVAADPDALVFTSPRGYALNHSNFSSDEWRPTLDKLGYPDMKFHDLRHFAGTTAAQAGATVKEVMKMLGHSTPRAAMIYQHAAEDRANVIAEGMDALAEVARKSMERAAEKATADKASEETTG